MEPTECPEYINHSCSDVIIDSYTAPPEHVDPEKIKVIMISEASPENFVDYFYAGEEPFYLQTTLQAFNDAGAPVKNLQDILDLGFYLTTAVKCPKTRSRISAATIKTVLLYLKKKLRSFLILRFLC